MDRSDQRINENALLERMHSLIDRWNARGDKREVFLHCYSLMTANMQAGIEKGAFLDGEWVSRLIITFAEYYFTALEQWEREPSSAPRVWQIAHEYTRQKESAVLQHLLLGINAHINYDLMLTVDEVLKADWDEMTDEQREDRYEDYCRVNAILTETIDAVQDEIIAPAMPMGALVDTLLGRFDEMLISRVITTWRDKTWYSAVWLLGAPDQDARSAVIAKVEEDAMTLAGHLSSGMKLK
ncbi:MAG: DUF5995 family protein [Bacteroidota bacterium]